MELFLLACLALIVGYIFYGLLAEKIFGISEKKTPAVQKADGVDFIPLPPYKIFLIQFLNIAGLGPVFGAILGAVYGPVCLFWIVLGSIFAGAVHDYFSGMISLRHDGKSATFLIEQYLGKHARYIGMALIIFMLLLVGSIFASSPAKMLQEMTGTSLTIWLCVIFGYYFLATLLPIDKIIGRFYPVFGLCLILSTFLLLFFLFKSGTEFYPNLNFHNQHPKGLPIFPLMFVTIACGAISGFHSTQSPMMARCLTHEKYGRPIFYGAMITEGIVALIWATLGISFYQGSAALGKAVGTIQPGGVVSEVSKGLLGDTMSVFVVISVIILSITTGDTCFRSARLSCADFFKVSQKQFSKRLALTLALFAGGIALAMIDTDKIWTYFGWLNQSLACTMLWVSSFYLKGKKKNYWITLVPAVFMTAVCSTYFAYAPILLGLPYRASVIFGVSVATIFGVLFLFRPFRKTTQGGIKK